MADIELVIKIPEEVYERFGYEYCEENSISERTNDIILDAFCNSTPLDKAIEDIKAESREHLDGDRYIRTDDVIKIIDRHISGKEQEE